MFYPLLRPFAFALPPETAHRAALLALRTGLIRCGSFTPDPCLKTDAFGLTFDHPLGLAAGFDKNAEAIAPLLRCGFAFVEAGTITPHPQPGNPPPRLFRLTEDEAVINRLGFPGEGKEKALARLAEFHGSKDTARNPKGILGINIGKNKNSEDAIADYVVLLQAVAPFADYVTVNISSPNTPGLRDLQNKEALNTLLAALMEMRMRLTEPVPLLLKIAPNITPAQVEDIAESALMHGIDGLIISNTTTARGALHSVHANETGGLSGKPLFGPSTECLSLFYRATEGRIPLIGAGGVASAEDAYAKIRAGATLVQLYTALVYQGFGLIKRIVEGLPQLLEQDGFTKTGEAVGVDAR